jgi:hypothetical protein
MNPNQLPAPAAEKFRSLVQAANDANALARSTLGSLDTLQDRLGEAQNLADSASDDIRAGKAKEHVASVQKQLEHLREVFQRRQAEHAQAQQIVNQVDLWLGRLHPEETRLEMVKPAAPDLREGETVAQAVDRIRKAISEAEAELAQTRRAPPPRGDLRSLAAEIVIARSRKGRPRLRCDPKQGLLVEWNNPESWSAGSVDDYVNLLAWLSPEVMAEKLFQEIDAQLKPEGGLSFAERETKLNQLVRQLDRLQREEESLIEMAAVQGLAIARRMHAAPSAILGVRILSSRQAAA